MPANTAATHRHRTNRRGQIIERSAGTFLIKVAAGSTADGKRLVHSKTVKGTRADADQALTEWLRALDQHTFVAPSKVSLATYAARWLAGKTHAVSARTLMGYERHLRLYLLPTLGALRLDRVTPEHLSALYGSLLSDHSLSPTTVRGLHQTVAMLFGDAMLSGSISRSPADRRLKAPRLVSRSGGTPLTPEEVAQFLEANAGSRWEPLWLILLSAGVRPQEALPLQVQDLRGTRLTIQRVVTVDTDGKRVVVDGAKSRNGLRTIELPAAVADRLRGGIPEGAKPTDWLLWGAWAVRGGIPDHSTVWDAWKAACRTAGVRAVRLYDTRHTHATTLLAMGGNVRAVAARLGHDPAQLLSVYAHVVAGADAQLAQMGWGNAGAQASVTLSADTTTTETGA